MPSLHEHLPFLSPSTRGIEQELIPKTGRGSNTAHPRSRSATILFVDDEPLILDAHRLWFEDMGYTVHAANSGEEALDLLKTQPVDAVVVDYVMPTMNGGECARRMRSLRYRIPIILFSGSVVSLPKPVLEIFDACVDKGLGSGVLAETLEYVLYPDESPARDIVQERAAK